MKRRFNTAGSCNPQRHYMVRLDDRLKKIKEDYVDYGSYFVINKGRQYGKTTTLRALENYLKEDYIVLSLDFQEIETGNFADGAIFSQTFAKKLSMVFRFVETNDKDELLKLLLNFRNYYLSRDKTPIFHSVILAGVYDIKNLKLILRPDSEHQYNNPWNIAAKFKINMSFPLSRLQECWRNTRQTIRRQWT